MQYTKVKFLTDEGTACTWTMNKRATYTLSQQGLCFHGKQCHEVSAGGGLELLSYRVTSVTFMDYAAHHSVTFRGLPLNCRGS